MFVRQNARWKSVQVLKEIAENRFFLAGFQRPISLLSLTRYQIFSLNPPIFRRACLSRCEGTAIQACFRDRPIARFLVFLTNRKIAPVQPELIRLENFENHVKVDARLSILLFSSFCEP